MKEKKPKDFKEWRKTMEKAIGKDDYIADLDADNIANRTKNGNNLLSSMNQYYNDLKDGNADTLRTEEFLTNHSYKDIEKEVLDRSGKEKLEDLKNDKTYKDTYDFLKKLKKNQKK